MWRSRYGILGGLLTGVILGCLSASTAWGYFFDDRREMSLSGFAYTRGTIALAGRHGGGPTALTKRATWSSIGTFSP